MVIINFIFRVVWVTSIIISLSVCSVLSAEQSVSDFDKLCKIYKDNVGIYNVATIPATKINELVTQIETELPNIINDYKHISNARKKDRYQLFKQVAQDNSDKKWDCPTMESYYAGS